MTAAETRTDVLVVGAGIAGLLAANEVQAAGRSVVVVDKGRGVGGRLATRRLATDTLHHDTARDETAHDGTVRGGTDGGAAPDARVDHGAQFFTVRTGRFGRLVDSLIAASVVHEWTRGFGHEPDGHPRYAARDGMTSVAKHLAAPLDVRTGCCLESIRDVGDAVVAVAEDGSTFRADRAIVTPPVPQSIALVGDAAPDALSSIRYDPTLCLLAVLDRPLPAPGAVQRPDGAPVEFVADNQAKGASAVPALTAHLTGAESARRWDDPDEDTVAAVAAMVAPYLGGARLHRPQLKRWRYATPTALHPDPVLVSGRLVFAGDAFGSPRVEGAATSGWAAAEALLRG